MIWLRWMHSLSVFAAGVRVRRGLFFFFTLTTENDRSLLWALYKIKRHAQFLDLDWTVGYCQVR